ncbi:dihydrolipoamide dehydrogenase [Cutibacterium acnes JCM 18909]|nr:dihydrolipoamide dehydrogenase [Cutibacterium acnes JCM 18909]
MGVTQTDVDFGKVQARSTRLDLSTNPRAKMQGLHDGFVKLFCRPATGNIIGGVVVSPRASELIHPISVAVAERIPVDAFQHDFTVYPSIGISFGGGTPVADLRRVNAPIAPGCEYPGRLEIVEEGRE